MSFSSSSRSLPSLILLLLLGSLHCQIIGGLDELRLSPAAGNGGMGGSGSGVSSTNSGAGSGGSAGAGITALWSKRFGDSTTQNVTDVAVDAAENIFVVGDFRGTLDFGTGTALVNAGGTDAFVAKLDGKGTVLWSVRFGGTGLDRIESLALTSAGDPVVAGSFDAPFSFGGTNFPHAGATDGFVLKLSGTNGDLVWGRRFGDASDQRMAGIAIVPGTQEIVGIGDFEGTVDFGGVQLTSAGARDLLFLSYSPNGDFTAAIRAGDADTQLARSLATNAAGDRFLAAQFMGTLNLGMPWTSAGAADAFLAKTLASNDVAWSHALGDLDTQFPTAITAMAGGEAAVVGAFEGAAQIDGNTITSVGTKFDAFMMRLGADGKVQWIRTIGDTDAMTVDDQEASDIVATDDGSVFVTGRVAGTVFFDGVTPSGPGDTDFFLMRIGPDGQTLWSLRAGSDNSQFGRAIASSGMNELVVAGDFRNSLDLGNDPLVSAGSNDVFVAKFSR